MIRGLHYHERGQDDLFVCLQGMVRVVVLDRETGETFTEDIGDDNPVAIYVPGRHAHGFEALTDLLFCYHVTEEYDPADPDEHGVCWDDPRVEDLWSTDRRSSRAGPRGVLLITGAGGQLGRALAEEFAGRRVALTGPSGTSTLPPPAGLERADLVLHAAAWTDVDGAEDDPQGAAAVNVGGTENVAALGAPLVDYSTDYVFDGRKGEPYVESDGPNPLGVRPHEAPRRGGRRRAGVDRPLARGSSVRRPQLRPHDAAAGRRARRGRGRRRPARLARPTSATSRRRRARSSSSVRHLPRRCGGRLHLGRLRRGDLRGGGPRLPRPPDLDRGVRPAGAAARVLGAAQREGRAGAAALARRPARVPRRDPRAEPRRIEPRWRATRS